MILTVDQTLLAGVGGRDNVIRYAQAHKLQLVEVTYPLPEDEMTELQGKVNRWLQRQAKKAQG